jgi:hypothetical protein
MGIFRKSVEIIQVSLNSYKNNGYFTRRSVSIHDNIIFRIRNVAYKSCSENQNTHFIFNNYFSRQMCRLWNNVENYGTARQTTEHKMIRRVRFECWVIKATEIHSEHFLLLRNKNGYVKAPHCYVLYVHCLHLWHSSGSCFQTLTNFRTLVFKEWRVPCSVACTVYFII